MMASTFGARIDDLIHSVGSGHLVGKVEVDQLYAHRQHEELGWQHPRGGGPKYLQAPLFEHYPGMLNRVADTVLSTEGPKIGMIQAMDSLSDDVAVRAPILLGFLRLSGHPSVVDDNVVVFDRPPAVPRLTEQELEVLHHLA
jgi:hypothetical protein